jgi:hypothetical protein
MDATSADTLLADWSLTDVPPKFKSSLQIRNNQVVAVLSSLGTSLQIR